jgi:hypothetical protein
MPNGVTYIRMEKDSSLKLVRVKNSNKRRNRNLKADYNDRNVRYTKIPRKKRKEML